MGTIDVLFVHPHGHLVSEAILPAGAVACLNAYDGPKRGVFSFELTPALVESAAVVAIDLFWATALEAVEAIVAFVRRHNADAPIVVGGVGASRVARTLEREVGVDYVLSQTNCESAFVEIVRSHAGSPRRGRHERLPTSVYLASEPRAGRPAHQVAAETHDTRWFSEALPVVRKTVHLTRACRNPQKVCRPCVLTRSFKKAEVGRGPLFGEADLLALFDSAPEDIQLFCGGLSLPALAEVFELVMAQDLSRRLELFTCGLLPENTARFLEFARGRPISLSHMVTWDARSWTKLRDVQAHVALLAEVVELARSNDLVHIHRSNASDEALEGILRAGGVDCDEIRFALNWSIMGSLGDTPAGLETARAFSHAAQRALAMRVFSPTLCNHYGIDTDPQLALPEPLAEAVDGGFVEALGRGLRRFETILPDELHFSCVGVRAARGGSLGDFDGGLVASEHLEVVGPSWPCELRVTATGWTMDAGEIAFDALPAGAGLVIIPTELLGLVGDAKAGELRVLPLPTGQVTNEYAVDFDIVEVRFPGRGGTRESQRLHRPRLTPFQSRVLALKERVHADGLRFAGFGLGEWAPMGDNRCLLTLSNGEHEVGILVEDPATSARSYAKSEAFAWSYRGSSPSREDPRAVAFARFHAYLLGYPGEAE